MHHKRVPTKERLHELLTYLPESGCFRRNVRTSQGNRAGDIVGVNPISHGYSRISIDGIPCQAHVLAWIYHYGEIPHGMEIDHIDHNRNNNRLENLRLVSRHQNNGNAGLSLHNSSGYKGVSWFKRKRLWRAYIKKMGKQHHLGYFPSAEDAAMAYNKAAIAYFGSDYANLNKINDRK